MELTFSHKYIKNNPTSTCRTILIEHIIQTGRRTLTSKRAIKYLHNWVGQKGKKRRREKKKSGQYQDSWEGAVKEERIPHLGRCPDWQRDQLGWKGSLKPSEKSPETNLRRGRQRKNHTGDQCHCLAHPSQRYSDRVWVLRLRPWRSVLGLASWKQPEEAR